MGKKVSFKVSQGVWPDDRKENSPNFWKKVAKTVAQQENAKIFTSKINGAACFCIFIDYRGRQRKYVAIYNAT